MNIREECFNFEMFCLESEQNNFALSLSENVEIISLNEGDIINKIEETIAKILENIAMFIDKVVQQAKKKMATIGFKSAKEKMDKIRQSTKDITSNEEVELKFNKAPYFNKSNVTDQDIESLTGVLSFTEVTLKIDMTHEFVKQYIDKKTIPTKEFAMKVFCDDIGISYKDNSNIQSIIGDCKDDIKVKAKDIRGKVGLVETQLKELDDFMSKDFKGCLDELIKVRNDMRKSAIKLRRGSFNFKFGKVSYLDSKDLTKNDFAKLANLAASTYSAYVHTMTSYLFATIRTQLSCFKHNINALSGILL